jgi:RNA polymerase sigma-70 factor, ECF subfamily
MSDQGHGAARWFAAARAGSQDALGQALADCRAYLLMIAGRELDRDLHAKAGASDLVQETLLEACRDFDGFHGHTEAELLDWLRKLLLHNLADFRRRYRGTKKRAMAREFVPVSDRSLGDPHLQAIAHGSSPSELRIRHEELEAVERALERLPDDYRRVILYRYQDELPFDEVGRRMGRTANAVEKLWLRAIERLRRELEQTG